MYVVKFVPSANLLYVNLINRSAKRTQKGKGKFLLPYITKDISMVKQIKVLYFCLSLPIYPLPLLLFLMRNCSHQSVQYSANGRS